MRKEKVLVVGFSPDAKKATKKQLKGKGFIVSFVDTAEEALVEMKSVRVVAINIDKYEALPYTMMRRGYSGRFVMVSGTGNGMQSFFVNGVKKYPVLLRATARAMQQEIAAL